MLQLPTLFPINKFPHLVKQGLIVPALQRSGKTAVINIWRAGYVCVPITIRDDLVTLDNRTKLPSGCTPDFSLCSSEIYYVVCVHFSEV